MIVEEIKNINKEISLYYCLFLIIDNSLFLYLTYLSNLFTDLTFLHLISLLLIFFITLFTSHSFPIFLLQNY